MVGVCRPTFERVKRNIEQNIRYFTSAYPEHTFTFMVLTYRNQFFQELSEFCRGRGIQAFFIAPMEEKDFIFPAVMRPNIYRLFYSVDYMLKQIPAGVHDCIVRLRLDTEVKSLELVVPKEGVYYSIKEPGLEKCSDNIGYGTCSVMRKVWMHRNCLIKGARSGPEDILYYAIHHHKCVIESIRFHFVLYQSSDSVFDGVPQWSKRSREWIHDGVNYILNDVTGDKE
jgi:hypothetical protein